MVHDGEVQHTTPRCLGQGMPIIVLPRCLGVTSLRGHASRLGMGRNSQELRVQGERFNATHFDWKSIPHVSVLLISFAMSSWESSPNDIQCVGP